MSHLAYRLEICEGGVVRMIYETDDATLARRRFLEEQLKILERERKAQAPLYTFVTLIGPDGILCTSDPALQQDYRGQIVSSISVNGGR